MRIGALWGPRIVEDCDGSGGTVEERWVDGGRPLVDLVHMADAVAQMIGWSDGREGLDYEYSSEVAARLKLDQRSVEVLISKVIRGAEEMLEVIGTI